MLAEAGFKFEVISPNVEESASAALTVRELTIWNATRKAMVVARTRPDAVVLGADTLVALKRSVIGKPGNLREAAAMIRRLSGREHQVCTGVFICSEAGQRAISFCVVSHVQFHALETEGISAYLAKINPLDKAGGYAAQGHGSEIISRIRGSYTNVVGLPMGETLRELRGFGITAGSVKRRS